MLGKGILAEVYEGRESRLPHYFAYRFRTIFTILANRDFMVERLCGHASRSFGTRLTPARSGRSLPVGKGLVSRCAPIEEELFAIGLGICPVSGLRYH
jgi:hypothetical protein